MVGLDRIPRSTSALLILGVAFLSACSDGSDNQTLLGSSVVVGSGTARTYVQIADGDMSEIGVRVSEAALTGLPTTGTVFLLPLPAGATTAPYKHVTLNWNPTGHPPAGVFTVPHFDAHFYTITEAERAAILPSDPDFATKAARSPIAEFVASGYVRDPGAIPNMGTHWTDPSSPEFNGQPFTRTFVYGSWDGAFTFYEPMFTKAFLDTKPAVAAASIKLPSKYAVPGLYPTAYKVGFDESSKEFVIALSGLVPRS